MKDASDFVPVVFARNVAEAEFYMTLLEDHDITVLIRDEDKNGGSESVKYGRGLPVLVPDEQLEEAELVIEQRHEIDDEFNDEFEQDQKEDKDEDENEDYSDFEEIDIDQHIDLDDSDEEDLF